MIPKNILEQANDIIKRGEEKDREYGDFSESMESSAKIASEITGKDITTRDMFICMIALKFGRLRYNDKRDTYIDAAAYLQGLHDYTLKDMFVKEPEIIVSSKDAYHITQLDELDFTFSDKVRHNKDGFVINVGFMKIVDNDLLISEDDVNFFLATEFNINYEKESVIVEKIAKSLNDKTFHKGDTVIAMLPLYGIESSEIYTVSDTVDGLIRFNGFNGWFMKEAFNLYKRK